MRTHFVRSNCLSFSTLKFVWTQIRKKGTGLKLKLVKPQTNNFLFSCSFLPSIVKGCVLLNVRFLSPLPSYKLLKFQILKRHSGHGA